MCVVDEELMVVAISWRRQLSMLYRVMLLQDLLVPVYENGRLLRDYTLDEIRQRAEIDIVNSVKRKSSPDDALSNGTV